MRAAYRKDAKNGFGAYRLQGYESFIIVLRQDR